ncbi:hypothetical protein EDF69_000250 [Sphingomonas sp. JUb134]|nr:hypothetical protein [Sphingomonas sp. JUb134]
MTPGIVHLEARQVVDDLVVPTDLTGIDQGRQRGHRKRLAGRADHEQRVGVDLWRRPLPAHAIAPGEHDLPVLDDRDRDAGRLTGDADGFYACVEPGGRVGQRRRPGQQQRQGEEAALHHGVSG